MPDKEQEEKKRKESRAHAAARMMGLLTKSELGHKLDFGSMMSFLGQGGPSSLPDAPRQMVQKLSGGHFSDPDQVSKSLYKSLKK